MFAGSLLAAMAVVLAAPNDARTQVPPRDRSTADAVIERCEVKAIHNQSVPGSDPGVLFNLHVVEGQKVEKGMEIARVDDRDAQAQAVVKQLEYEIAQQKASSDIEIRHAESSANVEEQQYRKLKAANAQSKNTVTQIEILRAEYAWEKAKLGIEKAKEEHESNILTARAKKAEVDAANVAVDRRILRAPFNGVVATIYKHEGEWVAPGDDVIHIVQVNRLRVIGRYTASEWMPADLENRKVTVEVALPRNRTVKVPGKVVYVPPVVAVGDVLLVWAEIETPMENGRELVREGLYATMTIHVNQPAEPDARPAAQAARTRK